MEKRITIPGIKRCLSEKEIARLYGFKWGKQKYWGREPDNYPHRRRISKQLEKKGINLPFSVIEFETENSLMRFYFYHYSEVNGIVDYINKKENRLVARIYHETISKHLFGDSCTLKDCLLGKPRCDGIEIKASDLEKAVMLPTKCGSALDNGQIIDYKGLPVTKRRSPSRYTDEDMERDRINADSPTSGIAGLLFKHF